MAKPPQGPGSRRPAGRGSANKGPARPIVRRGTVRLPYDVARRVRAGHPWIFKEALGPRVVNEQPGSVIEVVDLDGEFVARGVFDDDSNIAVRVLTTNPREKADGALLKARVARAIDFRRRLISFDEFQCLRLINAESDGIPAVVVERYDQYLVVQLFSAAMETFRDDIYDALEAELSPAAIYEQRRYRSLAGDAPKQAAAELVRGNPAPVELEIREGALKFSCDVTSPLSTGLFADLRLGREAVARWAKGKRVLNLFSYTGAISVYAKSGGATEVCAIDVAAKAHARARKNFVLSGFDAETPEHIVGDTFKVLAKFVERGRKFDMVVIDPPAFASGSRGGKPWSAVRDYAELVGACLDVLEPGGVFIAASSTHKMTGMEFGIALAEGAVRANTTLRVVERVSLPVDFPTLPSFPEGNYLKFAIAIRD